MRSSTGYSTWRVIKPSIKAASITTGITPTAIFSPRLADRLNDSMRL